MTRSNRNTGTGFAHPLLLIALVCAAIGSAEDARAGQYLINGQPVSAEDAWLLEQTGLPAGAYWVDEVGNVGPEGSDVPLFRIDEDGFIVDPMVSTPPADRVWEEPAPYPSPAAEPPPPVASPPHATGPVAGVDGTRVFWIQTSILSNSGASGYVHFCPGGRFYTSSEGSFSVAGGGGWAGGAFDASSTGRWTMTQSEGEPYVDMLYDDGDTGGYWLSDLTSGSSWRRGQWKYAAEPGRASCP